MCGHWAAVEFLAGMGIAEIGLIQSELQGLAAITEPPDDYDIKQPVESNTLLKIASSRIFKLFLMGMSATPEPQYRRHRRWFTNGVGPPILSQLRARLRPRRRP
jgi:hypothetical protein